MPRWDWEASVAGDAAELEHTGQDWSCLRTLTSWAGESVPLTQHICLSAETDPAHTPQGGLKRAFLCKMFWDPGRCLANHMQSAVH